MKHRFTVTKSQPYVIIDNIIELDKKGNRLPKKLITNKNLFSKRLCKDFAKKLDIEIGWKGDVKDAIK